MGKSIVMPALDRAQVASAMNQYRDRDGDAGRGRHLRKSANDLGKAQTLSEFLMADRAF